MTTDDAANERQQADSRMMMQLKPHGFVFPANLPPCSQCGYGANEGAHINPPRTGSSGISYIGGERRRIMAADKFPMRQLRRSHVYSTGYSGFIQNLSCAACGQSMGASSHQPGLPTGMGVSTQMAAAEVQEETTHEVEQQKAFVSHIGGKTILSAPANVFTDPEGLPRELAAEWERASAQNPHFMWIEGRYVEADMPNRNAAAWSTEDLELGEPTIAHGPLNWLHEERHIIGTIAAAKLVHPDREAANAGSRAHIRSLAAVWRFVWPTEARQIAVASEDRKLWFSMECISREVACMAEGCEHVQPYADYMRQPLTRCDHVKQGGPRRFVDPAFLGGAVIIPPVRPGWGGATATVLREAAAMTEGQEASLTGLSEEEAVNMVAQIIAYANGETVA